MDGGFWGALADTTLPGLSGITGITGIAGRVPGGSFGPIIIMVSALLGRKMTPNFHIILIFHGFG